jgi:serine/threonine protein kinase
VLLRCIFIVLKNQPAIKTCKIEELIEMIKNLAYDPTRVIQNYNEELGKLILSMLNPDPEKRITLDAILKEDIIVSNLWNSYGMLLKSKRIYSLNFR